CGGGEQRKRQARGGESGGRAAQELASVHGRDRIGEGRVILSTPRTARAPGSPGTSPCSANGTVEPGAPRRRGDGRCRRPGPAAGSVPSYGWQRGHQVLVRWPMLASRNGVPQAGQGRPTRP